MIAQARQFKADSLPFPAPPADVLLVNMPVSPITHPSIAIGILTAALRNAGISAAGYYANLAFCEQVGAPAYLSVQATRTSLLLGEWLFAESAFREKTVDAEMYLSEIAPELFGGVRLPLSMVKGELPLLRQEAGRFVEAAAAAIVAAHPRIVGCTSMFHQHAPSLALLRRIRELAPRIITVMGGPNCESAMGVATLEAFPWVDYVVSGEADLLIVPFVERLLKDSSIGLPEGVMRSPVLSGSNGDWLRQKARPPRAVLKELDQSPTPDYDDFFHQLAACEFSARTIPALLAESSRGCWWGRKSHCTFCGLNGSGMNFRAKQPQRVLAEFRGLSGRYGIRNIEVVDNILDMAHLKTVVPELARTAAKETPLNLFYETKANLKREQVALLAEAGIRWLQPGIESLHDRVLQLMRKGATALVNLQLLRYSREYGVRLAWNVIAGFPGEDDAWYEEMAQWIPLVYHLQPPTCMVRLRYDRFSPYFNEAEAHGLELRPLPVYREVFPVDAAQMADLAYFFEDTGTQAGGISPLESPGRKRVREQVKEWIEVFWNEQRPVILGMTDDGRKLRIIDTRPCKKQSRVVLEGVERAIYLACDRAPTAEALERMFCAGGPPSISPEDLRAAIRRFETAGLVLPVGPYKLALAVPGRLPDLPKRSEFPGGQPPEPPQPTFLPRNRETLLDGIAAA